MNVTSRVQAHFVLAALGTVLGALPLPALAADTDGDGIDSGDNCPSAFNPLQQDCNGDGVGDACNTAGAAGSDPDQDGICTPTDNCSTPNRDQGDCNGNGVGDLCEASSSNRDNDRDGLCNAVDACPQEPGNVCALQAITVPFDPRAPSVPHPTYSGATHTLKGVARYGANEFRWDFGDGTAPTGWTAITDPYNLGFNHVFTGAVGQTFVATLSVRNSGNPSVVASAPYQVKVHDSGPLPPTLQMDPARMDVRVNMALEQALWFLHTSMTRATSADGSPGYAQPYGVWGATTLAGQCHALNALLTLGHLPGGDFARDPYVETAQRALNQLLAAHASTSPIGNQVHAGVTDRPDYNLNGVGLALGPNDFVTNGACLAALTHAGTPERQSLVGSSATIRGRTYRQLIQDAVEWFAFGQSDSGTFRGGWRLLANSNDAATWEGMTDVLPALLGARAAGAVIPGFVRTEMPYFMSVPRHSAPDTLHGGWGFQSANDAYVNHRGTAAGLMFHAFAGGSASHPEVQGALGFLYRWWAANGYGGGGSYNGMLGWSTAMYDVATGLRAASPSSSRIAEYNYNTGTPTLNGFDWYYQPPGQSQEGLAPNLIKRQAANGSWADSFGAIPQGGVHATALGVLVLRGPQSASRPTAAICRCSETWARDQDVTVEGSCSSHPDPDRSIVSYEWDFDFDGTFAPSASGITATLGGGYPSHGLKPVALRVTDDTPAAQGGPRTSIATCSIEVKPPNNCPHPRAGGPYSGTHDVPVALTASASFDPDGDPLTYAWDLDNDGAFDDATGAAPQPSYSSPGTYPIAVRVTDARDDGGLTSPCATVDFTLVTIGNGAPVANPGGPYVAGAGATVMLDGSASSDPEDQPLSYAWDLDGDGRYTDSASASPGFTIPQGTPAGTSFPVCLEVSDGSATSARACTTVSVNRPPVCVQTRPTAVAQCTGGALALQLDARDSSDPDGDPLDFSWSTDCPGATLDPASAAATTLSLGSGGVCTSECRATLTVRDPWQQAECAVVVTVEDSLAPAFTATPQALVLECDGSQQVQLAGWLATATAVDACTEVTVAQDFQGLTGGCAPQTGSAQVTWTATDGCSHGVTTAASVEVTDTAAPTVTCPAPATVECQGSGTEVALSAAVVDACSGPLSSTASVQQYPRGTTPVGLQASDACGNTGSCSTTVTVVDTTAPRFEAGSLAARTVSGRCDDQAVTFPLPTAVDVCGPVSVACPQVPGTPHGSRTITCTATDEAGNVGTAELVVNVTNPGCTVASDGGTDGGTGSGLDAGTDGGSGGRADAGTDGGTGAPDGGSRPPGDRDPPRCGCTAGGGESGLLALLALGRILLRRRRRHPAK